MFNPLAFERVLDFLEKLLNLDRLASSVKESKTTTGGKHVALVNCVDFPVEEEAFLP